MFSNQTDVNIITRTGSLPTIEYTYLKDIKILSSQRVCYFPKGPWKKNKIKEVITPINDSIYILKLNNETKERSVKFIGENFNEFTEEKSNFLAYDLIKGIATLNIKSLRSSELRLMPPFRKSTAYNFENGHFLGLHIDTHDSILNINRPHSWSILGINLGNSERYIHYVDLTFNKILSLLNIENSVNIANNSIPMHKIVHLFFQKFPSYPIKRIKVLPGFATLLNSQNVIHDGGTNWKGNDDVSFLISGNFTLTS